MRVFFFGFFSHSYAATAQQPWTQPMCSCEKKNKSGNFPEIFRKQSEFFRIFSGFFPVMFRKNSGKKSVFVFFSQLRCYSSAALDSANLYSCCVFIGPPHCKKTAHRHIKQTLRSTANTRAICWNCSTCLILTAWLSWGVGGFWTV